MFLSRRFKVGGLCNARSVVCRGWVCRTERLLATLSVLFLRKKLLKDEKMAMSDIAKLRLVDYV